MAIIALVVSSLTVTVLAFATTENDVVVIAGALVILASGIEAVSTISIIDENGLVLVVDELPEPLEVVIIAGSVVVPI